MWGSKLVIGDKVSGSSPLVDSLFTRVLLAGEAEAREEHRQAVRTRGLKQSSTFRNYTHSEPRFRTLLAEGASEVELALI
jgi:hypothetical protein